MRCLPALTLCLLIGLSAAGGCRSEPAGPGAGEIEPPNDPVPSERTGVEQAPVERTPTEQAAADPAGTAEPVRLEVADEARLAELLRQHRGRVVLLDSWATWCLPCLQQFPHTVRLHRELAGQGLVVITLNFDDEEDRPRVEEFLEQQRATMTNLANRYGFSEEAFERFEIRGGALPNYKLYDRQGRLLREFVSGDPDEIFTTDDIDRAIRAALAEEG